MIYDFYINKDIKDRFKIFSDDKLIFSGYKEGNSTSFFDAFIGSSFDKGCNFVFYDNDENAVMKVERIFYEKNKKYIVNTDKKSFTLESDMSNSIKYNNELDIDISDFKEVNVLGFGSIKLNKKNFSIYEKFTLEVDDKDNLFYVIAVSLFIWDVFIKERLGFIK
ncbi:hypothetical protein [uncultured Finegoldia sp.]|uniref:hypothetical protein n=1 Tax=uncultured Finegoldia sp. TaxID=328009 RepID=UPI00262210F2|nr:hypothetical protein [uncultured Finegoldia sp.]